MNEIDKKLQSYMERAKEVLGLKVINLSDSDLIEASKLIVEVAKMIQKEESI